MNNYKHLNFKSYLDNDYDADRLIVQIESLQKLSNNDFIDEYTEQIKKYDLIILGSAVRAPSPGSGSMNRDNDVSRYDFLSVYLHRHKSIFLLAFCLIHYLVLYYDQVISSGIEQHLPTHSFPTRRSSDLR